MLVYRSVTTTLFGVAAFALVDPAAADTCLGTCGTLGANGVVTAPPSGAGQYGYVTTNNSTSTAGRLNISGATNGSVFTTTAFSADPGTSLAFNFNYITSDGAGFSDFAYALLRPAGGEDIVLFTARTIVSGNTVPGFGLPGLASGVTLSPPATPIIAGAPVWSPLGSSSSGRCYASGCGYTGWIGMDYTISATGSYSLVFGVFNVNDQSYASGLAFDGILVGGEPLPAVPEPATWAMMIAGFGLVGGAMRRRRVLVAA